MIDGPRRAPASGGRARQLVVLLHGYGSNGDDLIELAPYWQGAAPDAAFLSPHAPDPIPGYPEGRQWFGFGPGRVDRGPRAAAAAEVIHAFLDAELDRHELTERDLVLVGFSQGTMMALQVAPRRRTTLAGVVGYSGALVGSDRLGLEALSRPPVLLCHGDADPMVPVSEAYHARDALASAGFQVDLLISPGLGHSVDEAGIRAGAAFLHRVFANHAS